jgi:hypothetical protein
MFSVPGLGGERDAVIIPGHVGRSWGSACALYEIFVEAEQYGYSVPLARQIRLYGGFSLIEKVEIKEF